MTASIKHAQSAPGTGECVHSRQNFVQCTYCPDAPVACQISQTEGPTEQPRAQSYARGKVTLELANIVEPPGPLTACGQSRLSCGVDQSMLELLVEGHQLEWLSQDIVPVPDMHAHARLAFQTTPVWNKVDTFSQVALFTDGSFKEGHELVAYAVVVLLQVQDQWQFAGFLSGAVETCGPNVVLQANAHVAELCGMIHARLIHVAAGSDVPVEICYDCMSACQVMCMGGHKGSPLDQLAASVDAMCFLQGLQPTWRHVAGHSGYFWNEAADFLAKRQLQAAIGDPEIATDLIKGMLSEGYMKWLWLAIAADVAPGCWPVARGDGSVLSSVPANGRQEKCVPPQRDVPCQHAFCVQAVTYNTLSLRVAGQAECLEQHFGNCGCCILGLHECRQPSAGLEHGSHF